MDNLLETTKEIIQKKEDAEKALRKYILSRVFGDIPEDPELGSRVKVSVSNIKILDGLGPQRSVTDGKISDLVRSWTREVSFTAIWASIFSCPLEMSRP